MVDLRQLLGMFLLTTFGINKQMLCIWFEQLRFLFTSRFSGICFEVVTTLYTKILIPALVPNFLTSWPLDREFHETHVDWTFDNIRLTLTCTADNTTGILLSFLD